MRCNGEAPGDCFASPYPFSLKSEPERSGFREFFPHRIAARNDSGEARLRQVGSRLLHAIHGMQRDGVWRLRRQPVPFFLEIRPRKIRLRGFFPHRMAARNDGPRCWASHHSAKLRIFSSLRVRGGDGCLKDEAGHLPLPYFPEMPEPPKQSPWDATGLVLGMAAGDCVASPCPFFLESEPERSDFEDSSPTASRFAMTVQGVGPHITRPNVRPHIRNVFCGAFFQKSDPPEAMTSRHEMQW